VRAAGRAAQTYAVAVASTFGVRRDAARSRAAILAAARELYASGRAVPMYEVGRRAGVGQATLYRHFPDRAALAEAVVSEQVERLEAIAAAGAADHRTVLAVLDAAVAAAVEIHDLVGILRTDAALAPVLADLRARVRVVFARTLERSRAVGLMREDVSADDLLLVVNMVNGALSGITTVGARRAAATRAFELASRGLLSEPAGR
jgi:AcrR family transcriptional regulator